MALRYKEPSEDPIKKAFPGGSKEDDQRRIAARYFRLRFARNNIYEKFVKESNERNALELWNCEQKIAKTEKKLDKNLKTTSDFYAMLDGVYTEYRNTFSKVAKNEIVNHVLYSIIMFQILLNGILNHFKEISAKMIFYSCCAATFSVIAGMASFKKLFYESKTYRRVEDAYYDALGKINEIKNKKMGNNRVNKNNTEE